ncbi:MAG: cytochrome P460 family protein [Rhodocyclaceae bacterium]|nr:cytochrome P460 family protein [Rhodocyclaceae bacterium]
MLKKIAVAVAIATLSVSALAADVAYPQQFRDGKHVKSMVINKGHPLYDAVGGMHHIYGNAKAIAGYKAGKFANGSVITFDLFEAVDRDNAVAEGAHKAVVVMAKDSKKYAATDGWGYQVFDPKTKKGSLDAKAQGECHACHVAQKDKDFVFSSLRD